LPEKPFIDHENYHFINPEKSGEKLFPYSSLSPIPSSSPKNRFVDYLLSSGNFPKSSPATFPAFVS
jgi:hypothetical protein